MSRIVYEFGPFRLDPQRHMFSRDGRPVPLAPKAFEILELLVDRHDTLVSKTDLLARIWPDSFVEENNLAQHVSQLRKTLGENAEKPQFIETVPRLGYRFIAEVRLIQDSRENGGPSANATQPDANPRRRNILVPAIGLGALMALTLFAYLFWPKPVVTVLDQVQLTHDGYPKQGPLMTDGEFLYFNEFRAGERVMVRVAMQGGEPVVLTRFPKGIIGLDLSMVRHEILAMESGPTGADHQLLTGRFPAEEFHPVEGMRVETAAWAAGGERILYSRGRRVYSARKDGAESKLLLDAPGRVAWLKASPDGRLVTMKIQRDQGPADELWEARLDGIHLRRVAAAAAPEAKHPAGTWTHDSRYFLFSNSGESKFWLWGSKQGSQGLEKEAPLRINIGLLSVLDILAAPDRNRIIAVGALDRMEIVRFDLKAAALAPYLPGVSADGLAFSRQGDWVAYATYPDRRLFRCRPDGSDSRELTSRPQQALMPAWSPDGKRIAYMQRVEPDPWKIQLISSDGGPPEQLLSSREPESHPTWSPDGKALIYGGVPWLNGFVPTSTAIHQIDLNTRQVVTLPDSTGLWSPRWSPNGRYLVAETADSQSLKLFDFAAKTWSALANAHGNTIGYSSWSNDSRYVYFNTYGDNPGSIYRVDVSDAEHVTALIRARVPMAVTIGAWFAFAPDDSLLFLRDAGIHEVLALDLRLP